MDYSFRKTLKRFRHWHIPRLFSGKSNWVKLILLKKVKFEGDISKVPELLRVFLNLVAIS